MARERASARASVPFCCMGAVTEQGFMGSTLCYRSPPSAPSHTRAYSRQPRIVRCTSPDLLPTAHNTPARGTGQTPIFCQNILFQSVFFWSQKKQETQIFKIILPFRTQEFAKK